MTTNQLFKITPDINIINLLLTSFGLENLEDTRLFTKDYMKQIKDYKWILKNKHTLYSKIVSLNIKECDI